jgi:glycolate oxidase iron-sulfur subunit
MRAVQWEGLEPGEDFIRSMESCVQCRGCETACPSGVHFGHLMEGTREELAARKRITPWWQRVAYRLLPRHRLLLAGSSALAVVQRIGLVPKRLGLPKLALHRPAAVRSTGHDAWLFTGCVMDAWQRETHRSTAAVLAAVGVGIQVPQRGGGCCGALHTHAGLTRESRSLAESVMASMPGDAPIVVNSAGCGAALKDYGHLLGTPQASAFSARVMDAQEFVATHIERLVPRRRMGAVIVQDPCHLRHVQRVQQHTRTVLSAVADVVELDDEGLCCGAGGAFSALQPELANEIRERKVASVSRAQRRSGATVVASGNPGCAMHLAAAGLEVRHPMDIVAEALR